MRDEGSLLSQPFLPPLSPSSRPVAASSVAPPMHCHKQKGTWSPRKTELERGRGTGRKTASSHGFSYHHHLTQSVFNARGGRARRKSKEMPVKGNTSPPLYLPVLSDGRAGVGQSQVDLHVALLFRVAPHPCHEPLNSAVLRLEVEMR